ncbi:beta strand repeat-containing protein [Pseudomonas sp. COR18]|uniref:beta strand repeat-containing protein n=1 Tax=Pseudomonas sp. COR18 TaxID=3399680 RepID=UPI003B0071C2
MAVINGTDGADTLAGTSGNDEINGLGGNDLILGSAGADKIDGGNGTDTVNYSSSTAAINVDLRYGVVGRTGMGGDAEGDTLVNVERVIGSAFDDTFSIDTLNATLEGGAGDDVYIISNTLGTAIIEQAGGGNDEVRTSYGAHTLSANIERLTYTGTGAFTGYGNAGDNIITGGIGNDTFYGGDGADQFIGGAGTDTVSYTESAVGVNLNFRTGVHSGIARGDTYNSIEAILGSNYNDIFVGDSRAMAFNGGTGIDLISYESSDAGVTIDLKTKVNGGDAAGDTYTGIELFQGSRFADTLSGSTANDNFIGGAGADVIDGREGIDTAWYANSSTAVNINLLTGVNQGGDAEGDVLINVESLIGSNFNDILTGNAVANGLEGGLGNDTIYGGDGDDVIYGSLYTALGPFAVDVTAAGPQADILYGGNGNDIIISAPDDRGTFAFGEAGNDTITVISGTADGGDGADILIGAGNNFSLFGGAGNDTLQMGLKVEFPWQMKSGGFADGGEGDDTYIVNTNQLVTIQDTGTSYGDKLVLNFLGSGMLLDRVGNDLYLHNNSVAAGEIPQEGVRLKDWFAGYDTIEQIQTADNQIINLPANSGDAFAMFG